MNLKNVDIAESKRWLDKRKKFQDLNLVGKIQEHQRLKDHLLLTVEVSKITEEMFGIS